MDNAEVSAKAEDALKFMKCEVRASFYFQRIIRTLFGNFARTCGFRDIILDRAEASVPEDLYKIDVLGGKTGRIIAKCDLREAKAVLLLLGEKPLEKENDFLRAFFTMCGLKVA